MWHYHLVCVENLAIGYLRGKGVTEMMTNRELVERYNHQPEWTDLAPPWNSTEISHMLGINPNDFARHTAMGDVDWAMAIYNKVMDSSTTGSGKLRSHRSSSYEKAGISLPRGLT
jgi:hypothetical protein